MIEKLKKDITQRSIIKNFKPMGNSSLNTHEFGYRYCVHEDYPENFFVVSKMFIYKGMSLEDCKNMVYIYDSEGNFIDDNEIKKKANGGFFDKLHDIKE